MHGGGKKVNRGLQPRRRNQSLSLVAIAKLVCRLQNKKHFGFCVSQQAVPFSIRRAQQGAQADAGYSASCFLLSCARRVLALRWACQKTKMNECTEAARK
jgi:hypothetical protein